MGKPRRPSCLFRTGSALITSVIHPFEEVMRECGLCGESALRAASYKVRCEDGSFRTYPGLQCGCCGRTQPDDEAIDWTDEVPSRFRERCDEVRSETRMKIAARRAS
jgi:hypothetical protein